MTCARSFFQRPLPGAQQFQKKTTTTIKVFFVRKGLKCL